jgi:hypothetical protein
MHTGTLAAALDPTPDRVDEQQQQKKKKKKKKKA